MASSVHKILIYSLHQLGLSFDQNIFFSAETWKDVKGLSTLANLMPFGPKFDKKGAFFVKNGSLFDKKGNFFDKFWSNRFTNLLMQTALYLRIHPSRFYVINYVFPPHLDGNVKSASRQATCKIFFSHWNIFLVSLQVGLYVCTLQISLQGASS